jgi:hypothetical protein
VLRHAKIELNADVFTQLCGRHHPGFRSLGLPLFQVYEHGVDEVVVTSNLDAKDPRYPAQGMQAIGKSPPG